MPAPQQQDRGDAHGGCSPDCTESTSAPVVSSASLFAAYHAQIRRYVLSIVRDAAEADDLTQEVFLRAHRKLGSLRTDDAALPWLYRTRETSVTTVSGSARACRQSTDET